MTEDEAKTKWCPFARFRLTGTDCAVNRDAPERDEGPVFGCIGSACMAWRATEPAPAMVTDPTVPAAKAFRVSDGREYEKHGVWKVERLPSTGFCGLAGSPQ